MRINSYQPPQNTDNSEPVKRQQQAQKTAQAAETDKDTATISSQAKTLQQKMASAPEIRQDRVDSIKQAMANGTYKVSNSQLAGAMFDELFKKG